MSTAAAVVAAAVLLIGGYLLVEYHHYLRTQRIRLEAETVTAERAELELARQGIEARLEETGTVAGGHWPAPVHRKPPRHLHRVV